MQAGADCDSWRCKCVIMSLGILPGSVKMPSRELKLRSDKSDISQFVFMMHGESAMNVNDWVVLVRLRESKVETRRCLRKCSRLWSAS